VFFDLLDRLALEALADDAARPRKEGTLRTRCRRLLFLSSLDALSKVFVMRKLYYSLAEVNVLLD
ncbi:MAG TPA: hypothetical protein VJ044_18015, partial [Candidatus Hodarchaeales archaeon]|nr:hypothetical protein [Candidatus Hodarchaeales archaeon]